MRSAARFGRHQHQSRPQPLARPQERVANRLAQVRRAIGVELRSNGRARHRCARATAANQVLAVRRWIEPRRIARRGVTRRERWTNSRRSSLPHCHSKTAAARRLCRCRAWSIFGDGDFAPLVRRCPPRGRLRFQRIVVAFIERLRDRIAVSIHAAQAVRSCARPSPTVAGNL